MDLPIARYFTYSATQHRFLINGDVKKFTYNAESDFTVVEMHDGTYGIALGDLNRFLRPLGPENPPEK